MNSYSYWSDPEHLSWHTHYFQGQYMRAAMLGFTRAWKTKELPKGLPGPTNYDPTAMIVTLLDTEDGKEYQTTMSAAYELEMFYSTVHDARWHAVKVDSLHSYFYGQHHCPCHRKQDAKKAGANTDDECVGNRFMVKSIVAQDKPELILYSETMQIEDLEDALNKTRPDVSQPALSELKQSTWYLTDAFREWLKRYKPGVLALVDAAGLKFVILYEAKYRCAIRFNGLKVTQSEYFDHVYGEVVGDDSFMVLDAHPELLANSERPENAKTLKDAKVGDTIYADMLLLGKRLGMNLGTSRRAKGVLRDKVAFTVSLTVGDTPNTVDVDVDVDDFAAHPFYVWAEPDLVSDVIVGQ